MTSLFVLRDIIKYRANEVKRKNLNRFYVKNELMATLEFDLNILDTAIMEYLERGGKLDMTYYLDVLKDGYKVLKDKKVKTLLSLTERRIKELE